MKGLKIIFATIMMVLLCASMADAQTRKKSSTSSKKKTTTAASKKRAADAKEEEKEDNFWTTKMWYGAEINYPTLGANVVKLSLSPMIGYKVNNWLSSGIILKNKYTWVNLEGSVTDRSKYEYIDFGAGLFVRARIFQGLFAHLDFDRTNYNTAIEFTSTTYIPNIDPTTNELLIGHSPRNSGYAGLGWSSGFGKWQSQIVLYRNLLNKGGKTRDDWDIRLGFAYNF